MRGWVYGVLAALIVMKSGWAVEPAAFTVGHDTTAVSEPRIEDGTIDYAAALNSKHGKGVEARENAAARLFELTEDVEENAALAKLLGVAGDAGRKGKVDVAALEPLDPRVEELKKAMARPLYFVPTLQPMEQQGILGEELLVGEKLCARAELLARKGNWEGCTSDLRAVMRLADLLGGGSWDRAMNRGVLQSKVCRTMVRLAQEEEAPRDVVKNWIAMLAAIAPLHLLREAVDEGVRFRELNRVMRMLRLDGTVFEDLSKLSVEEVFGIRSAAPRCEMDEPTWDIVLRETNRRVDEAVKVWEKGSFDSIRKYGEGLRKEMLAGGLPGTWWDAMAEVKGGSREEYEAARLKLVDSVRQYFRRRNGEGLEAYSTRLTLYTARELAFCVAMEVDCARKTAETRETGLVLAALLFRQDLGRLPARVHELRGKYWTGETGDPFHGEKELQMREVERQLRIYSVGPDSRDDGGDDGEHDDIVVAIEAGKSRE